MSQRKVSAAGKGAATPKRPGRGAAARAAATRRKRTRIALVAGATAAVVGLGVLAFTAGSDTRGFSTKTTAWDLPSFTDSHQHVRLSQFAGRPVVVNFFASWCTACESELPGLAAKAAAYRGDIDFVEVDSLETGDGQAMATRHHLAQAGAVLARDVGGGNGSGLHDALGGGNSMPLTAFYDANGRLLDVERTALPEQTLQQLIDRFYADRN